ncbi:hypothetical protein GpartN1_g262.t1 [Galdieria partita]|uniref:tRNA/rRNA methyltransferase SpoU type domain-containing protein n=1 Tax=Galdieria partita TaxID=83374 RepID=A0A9C7UMP5_9RHOD|nr:hypothetical protein GpartN1_g262.t1 [Galdieria partita]
MMLTHKSNLNDKTLRVPLEVTFVHSLNTFLGNRFKKNFEPIRKTKFIREKQHTSWRVGRLVRASISQIRIVLVEPEGADNVGSVSRVMRNFNFSKLILVNPKCNYMEGRARAMRGIDVLTNCKVVMSLAEALNGCTRVVASTSRQRDSCADLVLEDPRSVLSWLTHSGFGSTAAIVFGRESSGLTNDELKLAHRFLKIPASEEYPVLNLAMAVGIVCYELYISSTETAVGNLNLRTTKASSEANFETKESLYKRLENLLLSISFISEQSKKKRMMRFRSMLNRLNMSTKEANMLHGVISHVEQTWKPKKSSD